MVRRLGLEMTHRPHGRPQKQRNGSCHLFCFHWLGPPMYLTLADDNYAVREAYVRATGERPGGASLLSRPRHQVERALAQARTKKQD